MNQKPVLQSEDLQQLVRDIDALLDAVGHAIDYAGYVPAEESIAARELSSFERPPSLEAAYSQGTILVETGADQLMAFARSITEPVLTISPWTTVRSILEVSALSSWLLDPALDATERVMRSYSLRHEGLIQQVRFARSIDSKEGAERVEARIAQIAADAKELGFKTVLDGRGIIVAIGIHMPGSTDLARDVLNQESTYRLLSAVEHGHAWAIQQAGFEKLQVGGRLYLEKNIESDAVLYLCHIATLSFRTSVERLFELFGWNPRDVFGIADALQERIFALFDPAKFPGDTIVDESA